MGGDMYISGCNEDKSCYIQCWCSRWDETDWNIVIETFMNKSNLKSLLDSCRVGGVGELWYILGSHVYYDTSWEKKNTIKITPINCNNSDLYDMRDEKLLYVKSINSTPFEGDSGLLEVKIEGMVSGGSL